MAASSVILVMRNRFSTYALLSFLLIPATSLGKDVYLSIAGSVGVFRTDTRIFNPSGTNDITITATYMPRVGAPNPAQIVKTITVPKRQMVIFDDVVSSLFQGTDLGAIKLSSTDDFVATSRIYARTDTGTLGQFVVGLEPTAARTKGVLIQLKANGAPGQPNTFRTNTGFVNPNATEATVTIRQYDRNNVVVGQALTITVPPMGVVFPVGGVLDPSAGNFSDAWLGYESSQPVFAFGSVVDNMTTDPTFIPAFEDTGTAAEQPQAKVFEVVASTSGNTAKFEVTPGGGNKIHVKLGDTVTLKLRTANSVTHGFTMQTYVPQDISLTPGTVKEVTFEAGQEGTFTFVCTVTTCSEGHTQMVGQLIVGEGGDPEPPGY